MALRDAITGSDATAGMLDEEIFAAAPGDFVANKPKRTRNTKEVLGKLNFWLITLGVVVAGVLAGNCLLWYRGQL